LATGGDQALVDFFMSGASRARGAALVDQIEAAFRDEYALILKLARARLVQERAPISTVTLAHEIYLHLRERDDLRFPTRQHFFAYVGRAMRSLLVDMARARIAQKRSAELLPLTFGAHVQDGGGTPEQLVALDEALQRLEQLDARLLEVAQMRIIMGMQVSDIASVLGVSEPTVKRDWQRAKEFLFDTIGASV
jgi:RNA polymerase sigma factor (TIGR02999 family)